MNNKAIFIIFVLALAVANMGVIRRNEDPIRDTQTDPILYKQKMEQEKDGVKGPLMYNVKYNPKDTFFIDPPYGRKGDVALKGESVETKPAEGASWWEEQPGEVTAPVFGDKIEDTSALEPKPEEAVTVQEQSVPEPPAAKAEESQNGGKEDYWW